MALNEAKEKVCQLENAIKKLDLIKKHLSRNASDIKGEIHSCVSHNLEFLRDREVNLLNKVDEVLSQKEEAIQEQQARLNQALGVLKTRMSLITSDSVFDKQMTDTLTMFNEIELSPGETPHIAFRADHISLKECILNYGSVDANALPLPSAFDDSKKPSVSLPRHLEEYEDAEHHIFYKTVEELKESDPVTKSITVNIPKLSTRIEDWLQKRSTPLEKSSSFPIHANSSSNGLNVPTKPCHSTTPGDINSLNNWLSQIKHHADLEEEHDFEIVDNNRSKRENTGSNGLREDLKSWIHNAPGYLESLCNMERTVPNYFQHIPVDSKYWLRQACQQMSSLEESKMDLFTHISKEPSTWLRSRASAKQQSQQDFQDREGTAMPLVFKERNMSHWLAQSSKPRQETTENSNNNCCRQDFCSLISTQTKQEYKTAPIAFQLEDICKANELCSSLSDCVCKPNCAIMYQQDLSGLKNPLDPTTVFCPLQLPQSEWLHSARDLISSEKMDVCESEIGNGKKNCREDYAEKNLLSHIADVTNDQWLFKPQGTLSTTTGTDAAVPVFKKSKEEANMWLRQTKENSSVEEVGGPKGFNYSPPCKSISDWLLPPTKQEMPSKEEDELMKDESEGWSLCSSPASFNSDQFSKDVKVATNYLQNWIL